MAEVTFNVLHSEWLADGERYEAGENKAEGTPEFLRLLAAAVSAGAVEVEGGLDVHEHGVETQEESEARLAEAMGEWVEPVWRPDGTREPGYWSGGWREGHQAQAELDAAAVAYTGVTSAPPDVESVEEVGDDA